MWLENLLEEYPKELKLRDGKTCVARPLRTQDAKAYHQFWLAVPETDRMFIKERVTDWKVVNTWCKHIDLQHTMPILAWSGARVIGDVTLHQDQGGWKRHIGHISVLVHPDYRRFGLGKLLVQEAVRLARAAGLERVEAEFVGGQAAALRLFGLLGFQPIVRLDDYVKDMQANRHDYVLTSLDLIVPEEYAGVG